MIRKKNGFSIIEILVAVTILSISLLSIISGVYAGIIAITGNKNFTKAMIISKSLLNEFQINRFRGLDINDEEVEGYPDFYYSREVKRFEHELFGPLDAKRVEIIVRWEERGRDREYILSYIYPVR